MNLFMASNDGNAGILVGAFEVRMPRQGAGILGDARITNVASLVTASWMFIDDCQSALLHKL